MKILKKAWNSKKKKKKKKKEILTENKGRKPVFCCFIAYYKKCMCTAGVAHAQR
jgi:hypothetical protein